LIKSFYLLPYCAFWQPNAPTYAPVQVQLRFFKRDFNDGIPYFCSEIFEVEHKFDRQQFHLQRPALFLGGEIVILMDGKHQRQTLGTGLDQYYVCIAELGVIGSTLEDFEVINNTKINSHHQNYPHKCSNVGQPQNNALKLHITSQLELPIGKFSGFFIGDLKERDQPHSFSQNLTPSSLGEEYTKDLPSSSTRCVIC